MADLGLFRVAKVLMPIMEERGAGTFLVTWQHSRHAWK